MQECAAPVPAKNYIGKSELVSFIAGTSFLAMVSDMISNFRGDYLNNIIMVSEKNQKIINSVSLIIIYLINFFITWFIDNFHGKRGKFRPIALACSIPFALFAFMMFYNPFSDSNSSASVIYLTAVVIIYNLISGLAHTANTVAIVITPNESERNRLMSVKALFNSVTAASPLLLVLILGIFKDKGWFSENTMYVIALAVCCCLYLFTIIPAMLRVKERLPYSNEKNSVFTGMREVLRNKNFWFMTFSHMVRAVRIIGTGFGIYVAGALLGSTSKYIFFALPTGIGSFLGMLAVKAMLKKYDVIKVYVIFGFISFAANAAAFFSGLMYLTAGGAFWQVLFVVALFTVGLQYAASTIIPNIFNADILAELELQTGGKRLEQTIAFTQSFFLLLGSLVTSVLGPFILLNEKAIGYVQGSAVQSQETSIKLVFFYTVFVGIFFIVSLLPLLGYKLNTARRAEITKALESIRGKRMAGQPSEQA